MRSWHRRRLTLRERVTLALGTLVAVFVVVLGTVAVFALGEQEDDLADAWVLAEARRLAVHAERGDLHDPGDAELFRPTTTLQAWLVDPDGRQLPEAVPRQLIGLRDGVHWRADEEGELHIAVLTTKRGRLIVQYDASATEAKVHEFAIYLSVLGALCIGVAFMFARWIASIVVGPIERVAAQLASWAPDTALIGTPGSDEEKKLLDAFQGVQSRFESLVAREREFMVNVRHEVRTPLTALRTDLEMLALSAGDDGARRARIQRALAMVDAVGAALESARAVSGGGLGSVQTIMLAACVDDAWASLQNDAGIERLAFVNEVPDDASVEGDRHSLLTILRNLIRNSAEHASPARCVVRFAGGSIEVADDGPGIAAEDLPLVFERYYRGRFRDASGITANERGIGLAIARQIADLNGWALSVRSAPGQGACFVLRVD